jgi:hypothetical protein
LDYFNKQGWGYADTQMVLDPVNDQVKLTGHRYLFSQQHLPSFKKWAEEVIHIDMSSTTPAQKDMQISPPIFNHVFLEELGDHGF